MEWLQEEDFQRRFDKHYRPKGIYLIDSLQSKISFSELSNILSISFCSNVDEKDGLGFRYRWFGSVGDLLFTITCLSNNCTMISLRGKDDLEEKYQWSFLEKLVDLQHHILSRITWIRTDFWVKADFRAEAKSSIFLII